MTTPDRMSGNVCKVFVNTVGYNIDMRFPLIKVFNVMLKRQFKVPKLFIHPVNKCVR